MFIFHQKLNGTESQQTPKLLELLDTQVFSGSVQWVLLEISWTYSSLKFIAGAGGRSPFFDFLLIKLDHLFKHEKDEHEEMFETTFQDFFGGG